MILLPYSLININKTSADSIIICIAGNDLVVPLGPLQKSSDSHRWIQARKLLLNSQFEALSLVNWNTSVVVPEEKKLFEKGTPDEQPRMNDDKSSSVNVN